MAMRADSVPAPDQAGEKAPRLSGQSRFHLANQILNLIRETKLEPGHHLREQQLADRFGVSRTPVRAALELLEQRAIVEARQNQGFFLRKPFDALQHAEMGVPSTNDERLYQRLIRDRLENAVPNSMTQSEIARRYNVDRISLMRTLSRLSEDGLIARNKGHGWTFLPALDTLVSRRASFEFRLTLEPACFLLPSFKAEPAVLERIRLQHLHIIAQSGGAAFSNTELFEADAAFHEMCAVFCNNSFFLQAIQHQNRLRRLLEYSSYANTSRVEAWCGEHLAIIGAIEKNDLHQASAAMRAHLETALAAAPGVPMAARDG